MKLGLVASVSWQIAIVIIGLILVLYLKNSLLTTLYLVYLIVMFDQIIFSFRLITAGLKLMVNRSYADFISLSKLIFTDFNYLEIDGKTPETPVIFLSNYPDQAIEYLLFGLLGDKITVVSRDTKDLNSLNKFLLSPVFRKDNHIPVPEKGGSYQASLESIAEHIKTRSIFIHPEADPVNHQRHKLNPLRSGIFKIAEQLGVAVVPLIWSNLNPKSKKHYLFVGNQIKGSAENLKIGFRNFAEEKFQLIRSLC